MTRTGIICDMPAAEYHSGPEVSSTLLRQPTPAHMRAYLDGLYEPSEAQRLGTTAHCLILEPATFAERFAVKPFGDGRTKAVKDAIAAWETTVAGREVLSSADGTTAAEIAASVRGHADAAKFLRIPGRAEVSVFWTDAATALPCRARIDWLAELDGELVIVDFKTTQDAGPEAFERSAWNYGYHRQLAWYAEGVECATGKAPWGCVVVAVEKSPPYLTAVHLYDGEAMDYGLRENREALATVSRCMTAGRWPGYDGIGTIGVPAWVRRNGNL